MREIKFRGYYNFKGNALYPPDKRWIYGYYYFQEGKHWIRDIDEWKFSHGVVEGSVGQYTGLKDKNGKEIYEGDIVIFALPNNQWSDGQEVEFSRCSFVTPSGGLFSLGFMQGAKNLELLEIIGNIYENKELLNE